MKKFSISLAVVGLFALAIQPVFAKATMHQLTSAIKKADISNGALISVSFKDISNGKTVFEFNSKRPMNPASVQKLVTLLPSVDALGENYEFKTQFYKNSDKNICIKMGADPYFTAKDLRSMVRELNNKKISVLKVVTIDDSILDGNEWGEGWQWDDDLNPLMPKFGSYNMDGNLLGITVTPTVKGAPANISTDVFYPTAFMNNILTGDSNDIRLVRKNYISPDVINADGTVSREVNLKIPVNYPRRYFILRLEDILRKQKICYYGDFNRAKLPKNCALIAEIKHPLAQAENDILRNSNNMMAETVFKLAGGKYFAQTGSAQSAIDMFNEYYKKRGVSTEGIKIVDGSGVSKNNLLTADFITEVLANEAKNCDFERFKDHMASPGEGTLTDRMLYFKDNLKAKTGTLSSVSSIAGYLKAKNGKTYAFCIIVNDSKSKSADKKSFEEYVLRNAYEEL